MSQSEARYTVRSLIVTALVAVIGTVLTLMCYRANRASTTGQLRAPKHVLGDIEVGSTTDEF